MSYSFGFVAPSKAKAKEDVAFNLAEVAKHQVCHERDREATVAAAHAFIDLLPDDEKRDVGVNISGSLGGTWENGTLTALDHAYVTIAVRLMDRVVEAPVSEA